MAWDYGRDPVCCVWQLYNLNVGNIHVYVMTSDFLLASNIELPHAQLAPCIVINVPLMSVLESPGIPVTGSPFILTLL